MLALPCQSEGHCGARVNTALCSGESISISTWFFVRRELGAAAAGAGIFAGEIEAEGVAVPRRELVVSSAWREPQDQAIVFD